MNNAATRRGIVDQFALLADESRRRHTDAVHALMAARRDLERANARLERMRRASILVESELTRDEEIPGDSDEAREIRARHRLARDLRAARTEEP